MQDKMSSITKTFQNVEPVYLRGPCSTEQYKRALIRPCLTSTRAAFQIFYLYFVFLSAFIQARSYVQARGGSCLLVSRRLN